MTAFYISKCSILLCILNLVGKCCIFCGKIQNIEFSDILFGNPFSGFKNFKLGFLFPRPLETVMIAFQVQNHFLTTSNYIQLHI